MDISLQVILNPATHDLSYNIEKEAMRYRRGDIIGVHLTGNVGIPSPNSRLGFVHITGVPNVGLQKARSKLLQVVLDPLDPGGTSVLRRRLWRIPPSIVPTALRNQLLNNREITITWTQAKPYIRKKLVVNRTDASQDDESVELMDSDIS